MPKTKAEIVIETIEHYLIEGNRAVRPNGACAYRITTPHGPPKKCAVGRCLTEEACKAAEGTDVDAGHLPANLGGKYGELDPFLQEEYRGHDLRFWMWLQIMHDRRICWDPERGGIERRRAIQDFDGGVAERKEILEAVERLGLCALHD